MNVAEVLSAHLWRGELLGCECGWNWPEERTHFCGEEERISKAHVLHQLDALKAAGYAVVELPAPDSPDTYDFGTDCTASWNAPDGEVEWYNVAVYSDLIQLEIDDDLGASEARLLAGVLLAAADAAEATP